LTEGITAFTYAATPPSRPPPPTQTKIACGGLCAICRSTSRPTVPCNERRKKGRRRGRAARGRGAALQ
jgi:hypothetical protein